MSLRIGTMQADGTVVLDGVTLTNLPGVGPVRPLPGPVPLLQEGRRILIARAGPVDPDSGTPTGGGSDLSGTNPDPNVAWGFTPAVPGAVPTFPAPGERPTPIHTYTGYDAWMELWKYTQADPGDGWTEVGFDDSTWRVGRDFHTRIPPSQWGNVVPDSTWWGYPTTVWQRHGFWAYGTAPSQFTMSGTDDTSRIWIDGVHPDPTAIDPETEEYAPIVATLDPGGHVLAIGPVDFA